MARRISAKRRAALIRDLINSDVDLTALHEKYSLSPDSLAQWIQDENNHRCLAGLCVLADLQTQILLSRFRMVAAGRLIELATATVDESKGGLDSARRACVDLLKLDLKRADITSESTGLSRLADSEDGVAGLRELLYAQTSTQSPLGLSTDQEMADQPDG